jgi:hypothetical protein
MYIMEFTLEEYFMVLLVSGLEEIVTLVYLRILFQCYISFLDHCNYESWKRIKLILYSSTLQFGSEEFFPKKMTHLQRDFL